MTKSQLISSALSVPAPAAPAAMAVRSDTSAVASLTRLSPCRIVTIRRGMPTRRAIAVAATASGGATTAPSAKAAQASTGSSHQTTQPDDEHVDQDQPDRQQRDRPTVAAEVDQRGVQRSGVQQRRQEADQDQLGAELELRDARDERRGQPDEGEDQRGRKAVAARERAERDDDSDEGDDLGGEVHRVIVPVRTKAADMSRPAATETIAAMAVALQGSHGQRNHHRFPSPLVRRRAARSLSAARSLTALPAEPRPSAHAVRKPCPVP